MDLNTILFEAHSGWRYIVIVVAVIVLIKFLIGWLGKREWGQWDQRLGMAFPIVIDVQWLLGLLLLLLKYGAAMAPFMEHIVTMTLALIVGHIGWSRVKKTEDSTAKFRTATIFFLIASILIALGVMRITPNA